MARKKLYGFMILGKDLLKYTDEVASLYGIVGAANMGDTWSLLFDKLNDAKSARNILEFIGATVSKEAGECWVDEQVYRSYRGDRI